MPHLPAKIKDMDTRSIQDAKALVPATTVAVGIEGLCDGVGYNSDGTAVKTVSIGVYAMEGVPDTTIWAGLKGPAIILDLKTGKLYGSVQSTIDSAITSFTANA